MKESSNKSPIASSVLIDAHVHFYDCFDENEFINSAFKNLSLYSRADGASSSMIGILMLTETSRYNWFEQQVRILSQTDNLYDKKVSETSLHQTNEEISFYIKKGNLLLYLVAGRQIVTSEGLEVLALGTTHSYKDGKSMAFTLDRIWKNNAIAVLPWAVGKWIGKRGKIVNDLVKTVDNDAFLLGDNSGRPYFWPTPGCFKLAEHQGIPVLPGSDPLPLAWEVSKVGSFGGVVDMSLDIEKPGQHIISMLRKRGAPIERYGKLESASHFLRNQIALRM